MKNNIKLILLFASFIIKQDCIAHMHVLKNFKNVYNEIVVGAKTSDSTGTVSISKLAIQQSIISTIPFLERALLTNSNPTILIVDETGYLTFEVVTVLGVVLNVAVPLTTSSSELSYQPNGNKYVRVIKGHSGCTDCGYTKNKIQVLRGAILEN